jgi:hypothetical protein
MVSAQVHLGLSRLLKRPKPRRRRGHGEGLNGVKQDVCARTLRSPRFSATLRFSFACVFPFFSSLLGRQRRYNRTSRNPLAFEFIPTTRSASHCRLRVRPVACLPVFPSS